MNKKLASALLIVGLIGIVAGYSSRPLVAQPTAATPEFIITDSNSTTPLIIGALSNVATNGQPWLVRYDSVNQENYLLQPRTNLLFGQSSTVYYQNADCTGQAYIDAPVASLGNGIQSLRGSGYGVGRQAGGGNPAGSFEGCVIVRGAGAGANNSDSIAGRFQSFSTPQCAASSPASNTVAAAVVDTSLCAVVLPFKAVTP